MAERGGRRAGALALAAAAVLLCACNNQAKRQQAELHDLGSWFPGAYVTATPAAAPAATPQTTQEKIALVIVQVFAPRIGRGVFYVQEMAAADPSRIMSQLLMNFKLDEEHGLIATVYTFVEPRRWRDGQLNRDVFTGIVMEDVVPSCVLVWTKQGEQYIARSHTRSCAGSGAAADAPAIALTADTLTLGGYRFERVQ
ncbi:MAG TPA: CpcT/CpeT family chromophore lyase [Steroidobacteraceae bacterium]|nr:CpcT/CpeT family chromophore lyase [Steroidobacteraceae bacterium]